MRVLLVEDDSALGADMKHALEAAGYVVDWTSSGRAALAATAAQSYTAVLLDLGLPGAGGIDVLRAIRAGDDPVPVLIVTANDSRSQKLAGLDLGADDYIVKPFDVDELLARIRACVRRRDSRASNVLSVGGVDLDLAARTVSRDGKPVTITAKELKVLTALMRNAGRFVSRQELDSALYDDGATVESNTIEVTIYALRRKLGNAFIVTARGLGYMTPKAP